MLDANVMLNFFPQGHHAFLTIPGSTSVVMGLCVSSVVSRTLVRGDVLFENLFYSLFSFTPRCTCFINIHSSVQEAQQ